MGEEGQKSRRGGEINGEEVEVEVQGQKRGGEGEGKEDR